MIANIFVIIGERIRVTRDPVVKSSQHWNFCQSLCQTVEEYRF